jgi:hypothetical protein
MYMACTAYIRDEKRWSRDITYHIEMPCTAYIRDEKVGRETSPKVHTWLKQPIYLMNKVGPD